MDEHSKTPIEMLGDLLAAMTARAVEAERQRDEALKSSDEWYQNWQRKDAELKKLEAEKKREAEGHEQLVNRLKEYIEELRNENTGLGDYIEQCEEGAHE